MWVVKVAIETCMQNTVPLMEQTDTLSALWMQLLIWGTHSRRLGQVKLIAHEPNYSCEGIYKVEGSLRGKGSLITCVSQSLLLLPFIGQRVKERGDKRKGAEPYISSSDPVNASFECPTHQHQNWQKSVCWFQGDFLLPLNVCYPAKRPTVLNTLCICLLLAAQMPPCLDLTRMKFLLVISSSLSSQYRLMLPLDCSPPSILDTSPRVISVKDKFNYVIHCRKRFHVYVLTLIEKSELWILAMRVSNT